MAASSSRQNWCKSLIALYAVSAFFLTLCFKLLLFHLFFKGSSWEELQKHLKNPQVPWTLCHGDFHAANMFFLPNDKDGEEESLIFHDWAVVGP